MPSMVLEIAAVDNKTASVVGSRTLYTVYTLRAQRHHYGTSRQIVFYMESLVKAYGKESQRRGLAKFMEQMDAKQWRTWHFSTQLERGQGESFNGILHFEIKKLQNHQFSPHPFMACWFRYMQAFKVISQINSETHYQPIKRSTDGRSMGRFLRIC